MYAKSTLIASWWYRQAWPDALTSDRAVKGNQYLVARANWYDQLAYEDGPPTDEERQRYNDAYIKWRDSGFNQQVFNELLEELS
jgi:hypothetical protein